MDWKAAILKAFPNASPLYRSALEFQWGEFEKAGILDNALRCAAFFATVGVESAGMTATRENLNYSARQIVAVFGIGKHSAAISAVEAARLAKNPPALAERVYGLGNPKKARELGNTKSGDGYYFRGIGPFQHTGRAKILDLLDRFGANNIEDLLAPGNLFSGAILFWVQNGLNEFADLNDIRTVRKRVNGGYNGFAEFEKTFNYLVKAMAGAKGVSGSEIAQAISVQDKQAMEFQRRLNDLGYNLEIDGKYGPKTKAAVMDFQRRNGLKADGILGPATMAVMNTRYSTSGPVNPPSVPLLSPDQQKATGAGAMGLAATGELVMSTARELTAMQLDSPYLRVIPLALLLVGLGFILWPMLRGKK